MSRRDIISAIIAVILTSTSSVFAADLLVPGVYPNIQAGINATVNGDTVIVADGTYTGAGNYNIDFLGKAITVISENGPNDCIIDCQNISGRRGFIFQNSEDTNSILSGFTIKRGKIGGNPAKGGGIYCSGSSPKIDNCKITNNRVFGDNGSTTGGSGLGGHAYGGGIYCTANSNPVITSCTIGSNYAYGGNGGVVVDPPDADGGHAYGGGLYATSDSEPILKDSEINSNVAEGGHGGAVEICCPITLWYEPGGNAYGGGLCCSSATIVNCIITQNESLGGSGDLGYGGDAYGGGANISSVSVKNCTFVQNDAIGGNGDPSGNSSGDGIKGGGTTAIINCILWSNGDDLYGCSATYSCIEDGDAGTGNISSDPCFVSGPLGDYYLSQTAAGQATNSPCVDTGSDTAINLGMDKFTTRTDGIGDKGAVDMGYHYPTGSADIDQNWYVDWSDFAFLATYWLQLCGPSDSNCLASDVTWDEYVDINDLGELAYCWLDCYVTSASSPDPANNIGCVDPNNTLLSWSAGNGALYQNVYFGIDFNDVNIATPDSNEYMGQQASTAWDPNSYDSNGLTPGTTYYWRIDQVGARCTAKGALWNFTTWLDPNLIGWWKLDDGSGSTATDSAGNNDGTLNGDPNWTTGQINGALDFDGNGDYVRTTCEDGPAQYTIALWYNLNEDIDTSTFTGYRALVSKTGDEVSGVDLWDIWFVTTYGLRLQNEKSSNNYAIVAYKPAMFYKEQWHHVVVTGTTTEGKIYFDGELKNTVSDNFVTGTWDDSVPFDIARPHAGTANRFFYGKIDDVRIYDRALSADEIFKLCQDGFGGRAFSPNPSNGATYVDPNIILSWSPGTDANSHDVYLGTDFDNVNDGIGGTFQGSYDVNSFDPCGLDPNTTHFWRIDEVSVSDTTKGDIWSFTTWSIFDPNLNLVSWWKLDDGSGSTATDSAGSNNGTVVDANWTTGQINGALDFDGDEDYVDLGTDPFSTLTQGTISAWVRPATDTGSLDILSAKEGTDKKDYFEFKIIDGNLNLYSKLSGPLLDTNGSTALQTNTWYHVVYTTDSSGNAFYVNGNPEAMTYTEGSSSSNVFFGDLPSGQLTAIGILRNYQSANVNDFNGKIDDVHIYDRALSNGDVLQLYQSGL